MEINQRENGAWAFVGVGVRPASTTLDSATPTITSGSGAPSSTEPAGSLYLRTDGSTADLLLYVMISTTWTPMVGAS